MRTITVVLHFTFVFKKVAARFPEISRDEIQQLADKPVNKNTVETMWMNVLDDVRQNKVLNDDIVKYEANELDEYLFQFFAEICK